MKIEMKILNKEFYPADQMHETEYYRIPRYATTGSAAIDLVCTEDLTVYPGETKMINTGLAIHIGSGHKTSMVNPSGYEPLGLAGLILPRSGLGSKGLILANTVGLIDEDYTGELKIAVWNRLPADELSVIMEDNNCSYEEAQNLRDGLIRIKAGDRIAQLMLIPVIKAQFDIVEDFSNSTQRGTGGFNSTGN